MYTKKDIIAQLKEMNAPQGGVVLMHTAMRLVGEVEGGAQGLLDAMIDYFTADGGLFCVPTHTWANLDTEKITLDMLTPESNLGALPTVAANDPRGIRSENPTHSMVVFGNRERAERFVADDASVLTPTSPDSCYGKLYQEGGQILLVGVSQNKNTYLHTVAEMLHLPNRMDTKPISVTVRRHSGEIVKRDFTLFQCSFTDDISLRFPQYETAFRYHGCIKDGFVGDAPAQLCDAVKMKEVIELIFSRSEGKDPLEGETPIPPMWYCRK